MNVPDRPFWTRTPKEIADSLQCGLDGLSDAEAARRRAAWGPNTDRRARRTGWSLAIGRRLIEPLSLVLLGAAVLSAATGDAASAGLILTMLLLSIGLDMVQERRAMRAAEMLRQSVAVRVRVERGGGLASLPAEALVPGDVIRLEAGDVVPADAVILSSTACLADEAALTGEPYAVRKREGVVDGTAPVEATNALFRGAVLAGGEARALVVGTGRGTLFGSAAAVLAEGDTLSPFQRDLRSLGFLIVRLTGVLVVVVLAAHVMFGRPVLQSLMFATALAVGLTPELLPMITTVTLARGATRLARRRVIVKRLASIHDLGAMTVLCTDKTGTITSARIVLDKALDASGRPSDGAARWASLAAGLAGDGSAIDGALIAARPDAAKGWTLLDHAPFDFDRRYSWVAASRGDERRLLLKGAPEAVLDLCSGVQTQDGPKALTPALRAAVLRQVDSLAREGLRTIAVATRPSDGDDAAPVDLVLAGVCAFADPPKPSAPAAIARLRTAGVKVRILSGDHPEAVRRIAMMMGLRGVVLTGDEVARLSAPALRVRVAGADAFARLTPSQKARVVSALQARGEVVGFLGDGINDAPGIKSADVGLSVDSATGVAREAADMILVASDLEVVADGVAEGRRTFLNILKYVRMGASSNFGNMLSMAVASLFLPFLPMLPLQILLNNMLYDISEVGIPLDDAPAEELAKPQGWNLPALVRFTLIMGALSSVFDMITFWALGLNHPASPAVFQTGWFMESMASQILVIFVIRVRRPFWTSFPHPVLAGSSLGALAVALVFPFTPWARLFGFATPPWPVLGGLAAIVSAYILCAEAAKRWAQPGPRRPAPRRPRRRQPILIEAKGAARQAA